VTTFSSEIFLGSYTDVINLMSDESRDNPSARQERQERARARVIPRLVDFEQAAIYLSASRDTIERLVGVGELQIVALPVSRHKRTGAGVRGGECRRRLLDLHDLDRLIERSKQKVSL
jgi:hypothetical protein